MTAAALSSDPVKPGTRYARRRREAIRAGTWQGWRVPIEVVREHTDKLRAQGMGARAIAEAAGLPVATVTAVVYPAFGREYVLTPTATALLRVTLADAPDWACIYVTGSRRRIEALMRRGWSGVYLGERLGMTGQAIYSIRCQAERITAYNARRIAALFDELETREGPSKHTRTRAERAGYALPGAWDDDTIDDPAAVPYNTTEDRPRRPGDVDEVAVHRAVHRGVSRDDLTVAERRIVVGRLADLGWSDPDIAEQIDVDDNTVLRIRQELAIPSRWSA